MNALARQIGSESVPSETQKDLYSYAEQVNMCSHQLTIVSKVKADIQVVGDEFKVTGLESITTLIQNVKNLLNAVIHSVRYAYIASTKVRLLYSMLKNLMFKSIFSTENHQIMLHQEFNGFLLHPINNHFSVHKQK